MSTEHPTACPHCGGKNGYSTTIRFRAARLYTWDGKDVDTENYEVTSESAARCTDCQKIVRRPTQSPV